jgi:hypothetical protein
MQPDDQESLDQVVLNRTPSQAKVFSRPGSLQGGRSTINAISGKGRYRTGGNPLAPGIIRRRYRSSQPVVDFRAAYFPKHRQYSQTYRQPSHPPRGAFDNEHIAAGLVVAPVAATKMRIRGAIRADVRCTKPNFVPLP